MAKPLRNNGHHAHSATTTRYDAHHQVLDRTYGALADLRRELADSKAAIAARTEILNAFAACADSQRSWLLLEDYFEKLSLARRDFAGEEWWPRLLQAQGQARLEGLALLFLRSNRPLPNELASHANYEQLAAMEQAEQEQRLSRFLDEWLLPPARIHLDSPRASLRVLCEARPLEDQPILHQLKVQFALFRPKSGEKVRIVSEIVELGTRSGHEQELFAPSDWDFILWLKDLYGEKKFDREWLTLDGMELLQWLARWGQTSRLELGNEKSLRFHGQLGELNPHLETVDNDLFFTHRLLLPGSEPCAPVAARFFAGYPTLILVNETFYLLRNPGPPGLFSAWISSPRLPVRRLSHRLLTHLRKNGSPKDLAWQTLCAAHPAVPQFVFELNEDTVRLRLLAQSELDQSVWQWNGNEWQMTKPAAKQKDKPQILDDPRLEPAADWLRRLDWFTPEPGLWVGDANDQFLNALAAAWPDRPTQAEYLGNPAFHRLFLSPRRLRPKLLVQGSGIDWFSVSAAWEAEGLKLTSADLERLRSATGRFVKLPDGGWMELDCAAVRAAHEAVSDLGLEGLSPVAQRVDLAKASHLDEATLNRFQDQSSTKTLRQRLAEFSGVPIVEIPPAVQAELRPYQKDGFNFLCHLTELKLGGILADDMGLGKTLQTLTWLAWLREENPKKRKPALVICPASVLHNWRREANRFAPHLQVLVLESGAARHNLRKQIPQHDLIVTNYALLRRDLSALQKFEFRALILDEAQFIKNPTAQVTQCVKQLKADHRLALTGTPLENRLLDLWSIVDFVQPSYLGTQADFHDNYEPKGEDAAWAQQIARRRLSAKIRPLMLRRLKRQVAQDLPDRIEQRRDCELTEEQRKLYLAELRRSREQVQQAVNEKGLAKSKIHILAALTRLRQICCHPQLVGNDSASGKTETLFELLEPLVAEGQKVLVFSQFVQMLRLLEDECQKRQFPIYLLCGETKNRQDVVQAFQDDPNASVFLLSLRAAGTGLNLTTASYVVLYDPWWNPAVEAQAIDRSHRIGQTRTVNAYRLIAPGTVEEKIWELQQRKAQTITDVLGEEGFARSLTKSDLEYLFAED
ncbi:MAG: DEAD/DEAH box helicase [Verrucomicrobia bacterium]|nr:DEAD/DEAH box helicase [Verrucomicrobiota bacterium]